MVRYTAFTRRASYLINRAVMLLVLFVDGGWRLVPNVVSVARNGNILVCLSSSGDALLEFNKANVATYTTNPKTAKLILEGLTGRPDANSRPHRRKTSSEHNERSSEPGLQ